MKTLLTILTTITLTVSPLFAEAPTPGTNLAKTLHQATNEKKMAFVLLGRESCGNCQATKKMVREGKIPVTADTFVMADLNIDDQRTEGDFMQKYRKEKFGDTLPFVVVTDLHGKALVSSNGYKSPEQWTALIAEAKTKAAAHAPK